jgi:nitroreductase/NAD-dependent dihydropyrimidine dehydrogenase PreA subunit
VAFLTIDAERCDRDGRCVAVCPFRLLRQDNDDSVPTTVKGAAKTCIACGHCMAVCPTGALSLVAMGDDCPPFARDLLPSFEQMTQLVRGRRSIRMYEERPVDRAEVQRIIELARYAPTGRNSQLVGWMVIDSRDEIARLTGLAVDWMRHLVTQQHPMVKLYGLESLLTSWDKGHDPILRHAPNLVLTHGPAKYPVAAMDSTIAMTTFELIAFSQGLGSCWAGFFMTAVKNWPPLAEALQLPAGHIMTTALMLGYPRMEYQRLPKRRKPRITWL